MSTLFRDHFVWVVIFGCVALSSCIRIIESPPMNCTQKELNCTAKISDCLDESWIREQRWTPSAPFGGVEVTGEVREDEHGDQVPVMLIKWRAAQDASIQYLKGTVVHVLKLSNNEKLCVQYEFQNKIKTQSNTYGAPWSFSLDRFVAEPGVKYEVSVHNLPRPNIQGDQDYKSRNFSMPDCRDVSIKRTKLCQLRGSLWEPNIAFFSDGLEATVQLDTGNHSEQYKVFLESYYESTVCNTHKQEITKEGQQTVNVTFSLKEWRATCCQFTVTIQPYFVGCSNDCVRQKKVFNTCKELDSSGPPDPPQKLYYLIPILGLLGVGIVGCCVITWKSNKTAEPRTGESEIESDPSATPLLLSPQKRKVLILYSQDHPLYRDVVLKFSAFLQAECGTDVLLDLLDTQRMGELGHLAWLAGRKQEIEGDSCNKILLLCSRGVRAKWQAMLGGERVLLKQDVLSPMGDMLTPALNLLLPDFKLPASFGKYVVAYFEGVSGEQDVPEPFHIAVKYKLMKHFEEIYFRLCGEEKHEPGRVKRVPGISEDEYFLKPSGHELRHAIEAFQVHQAAHPDWFQRECLQSEEEAFGGAEEEEEHIQGQLHKTCMHQVVLQYEKTAPPCVLNEVLSSQPTAGVLALSPMLREVEHGVVSQAVLCNAGPELCQVFMSQPVLPDARGSSCAQVLVCPSAVEEGSCLRAELSLQTPALLEKNESSVFREELGEEGEGLGEEGEGLGEEVSEQGEAQLQPPSHLSPEVWHSLLALQQSQSALLDPSLLSAPDQPGHSNKRLSDQGYISRNSLEPDPQSDPMAEVRRLQQECFMDSLRSPGLPALARPPS
ncbi:interleukin-17 receptor A-like isoform X1 [Acipenser ruthenus]|uniref:interleukin-17 receptor A-like isoform X1 n=2 Tax=Acipenser ruthenus TaxID=7906 RepID=UPI002740C39A|nr:interleukin-17 receptor A-like isoform X1 [Acipenser ruthenus]